MLLKNSSTTGPHSKTRQTTLLRRKLLPPSGERKLETKFTQSSKNCVMPYIAEYLEVITTKVNKKLFRKLHGPKI